MIGTSNKTLAAIHGLLFLGCFVIVNAGIPSLAWPWYLLLPLLVYAGIVLAIPPLRRSAPKLAVGRMLGWPLAFAILLALTTAAVLIGFHTLVQPDVTEVAGKFPVAWLGNLLLAGIVFSVINAAAEELIFRGVLWQLICEEWNQAAALAVTALLFGLVHLRGYPPGPIGAVLAGLFAVALGMLRWWTGGLGLAIACHIVADATIFCIVAERVPSN